MENKKYTIGDTIEFNFYCAGVISSEKSKIIKITNKYIEISDGDPEYRFDRKTGECINEENYFGGYRKIEDKYLKNIVNNSLKTKSNKRK